jgi:protein-arginine kinase activator protein McsA
MDYSTRLLYKDKMHPEIYNSKIPFKEKLWLQNHLDLKHKGDFKALLHDMMEYAILPEVEDYENAAEIRDYLKEINGLTSNTPRQEI